MNVILGLEVRKKDEEVFPHFWTKKNEHDRTWGTTLSQKRGHGRYSRSETEKRKREFFLTSRPRTTSMTAFCTCRRDCTDLDGAAKHQQRLPCLVHRL
jgi:hypothetical protein